ncbi:30S ribosome-binding factor RbfA [Pararhodobacter sp. SW119]|uniref:30S ribosome-binding factor RbfA n=1 Tax=Pararhodobacter sp. SW119 TaxID=2780075 RepID=UPI001ADEEA2B|nr:30S ribosome-binding factor RbfA [Pararhodobacter sp. SW119]
MAKGRFNPGKGPTQRQLRVGEVIRRRLSDVLMRGDHHDAELSAYSITVSEVRTSPDLKVATAFVMPLGGAGADVVLAGLRRNSAELRHLVARGLELKYAPELRFVLDESFDRMDTARQLFAEPRVQADLAEPDDDDPRG